MGEKRKVKAIVGERRWGRSAPEVEAAWKGGTDGS